MDAPNTALRVLVVDVEPSAREELRQALATDRGLEIAACTAAVDPPVMALARTVDVALVCVNAGREQQALADARALASAGAERIVLLGDAPGRQMAAALPAIRAAGWSYLLRRSHVDGADLARAVHAAASGLVMLDPTVLSGMARRDGRVSTLTPRQKQVLALMARGYNNASIARELVLEEKSVENHINAIFGHLNVGRDRAVHPRVKAVLLYLQEHDDEAAGDPPAAGRLRPAA